jgi:hypothetical protein
MKLMRQVLIGVVIALLLGSGLGAPMAAQERELPTGAGRVVAKVEFQIMVARIQLDVHVGRILENNAGAIPGK